MSDFKTREDVVDVVVLCVVDKGHWNAQVCKRDTVSGFRGNLQVLCFLSCLSLKEQLETPGIRWFYVSSISDFFSM